MRGHPSPNSNCLPWSPVAGCLFQPDPPEADPPCIVRGLIRRSLLRSLPAPLKSFLPTKIFPALTP